MRHELACRRLPDLLSEHAGDRELRRHLALCHDCQRQLFLLQRVDALLRAQRATPMPLPRPSRPHRLVRLVGSGAVAAALVLALLLPRHGATRQLRFHSIAAPRAVVQGSLTATARENAALTIVARGLPSESTGGTYLLWGSATRDEPVLVGRFMADPRGECRARFRLPPARWTRLWITPAASPGTVMATADL